MLVFPKRLTNGRTMGTFCFGLTRTYEKKAALPNTIAAVKKLLVTTAKSVQSVMPLGLRRAEASDPRARKPTGRPVGRRSNIGGRTNNVLACVYDKLTPPDQLV